MSTSLFMICEECEEKSNSILTHSCFWKKCCVYEDNFASFISKHFDKGCNFRNFKIIQEGDEDEENYKFDHEKDEDRVRKENCESYNPGTVGQVAYINDLGILEWRDDD